MPRHSLAAGSLLFVSVTIASSGRAQEPTVTARAEALFQTGRQLMREGRYVEACPKLEESQKLDPAPGTRLNLADCWERAGRTASAQREFSQVADSAEQAGEKERAAVARARAKQLENRVTRLALMVPAQARVPGLELLRNSVALPEQEWSTAQPVDPGPFVIEARAPGRRTYRSEFTLRADAATHNLTIPVLVPEGDRRALGAEAESPKTTRAQWMQRGGIGLAGLGVVGITLGTVFGVRAVSLYHRSQDEGCDDDDVCNASALETRHSAVDAGHVSTASFVIGGVLLAGGAGLYVWGSRERAAERAGLSARLVPFADGGYAALSGDF
jgi:hypothetical protein